MNKSPIRLLSPELCNQIAAGEVVERPASILKELVENSLDAGATQIDARLDNGGQSLVRVQDNGRGIPAAELELAVTRHATSKIASIEDLDHIISYGFRGEALPSIASVSHFRIISVCKADGLPAGVASSLTVEHGKNGQITTAALPKGTVVEARDIFANMPGRLKFLKQPASELKKAQNWLARLAIARPEIGFSMFAGERQIMRFAQGENLRQRLRHIWPADMVEELLPLDTTMHGIRVTGLAAPPHLHQPKADRALFYVNGRAVNDRRLLAAVREAYKGRQISRDYPQLALFLDINPAEVDVNAHPAKTEVRFRNESAIFSAVFAAIGNAFQTGGPTASQIPAQGFWGEMDRDRILPKPKPAEPGPVFDETKTQPEDDYAFANLKPPSPARAPIYEPSSLPEPPRFEHALAEGRADYQPGIAPITPNKAPLPTYLGQVANTYLVLTDGNVLSLLDQHAAHERILYHKFSCGGMRGSGQRLIVPLELPFDENCAERFETVKTHLEQLGFSFKTPTGQCLIVDMICPLLQRAGAREFLTEVMEGRKNSLTDIWISMACHAAIKAGQKLGAAEAMELLREWQNTPDADFCPHGRPCVLRFDDQALERMFKRR